MKSKVCRARPHARDRRYRHTLVMVCAVYLYLQNGRLPAVTYLKSVGPPVIRIDSAYPRGTVFPTEFTFDESKPKVPAKPAVPATPVLAEATNNTPEVVKNPTPVSTPTNYVATPFPMGASPAPPSVSDISIVTPQMVVDFLKPAAGGPTDGKGAALLVPVKINFAPPVPANNSSTATYRKE